MVPTMNLEQWTRIEQLFHLAAGHDGADREALLAKLCPDDAAIRLEVLSLLEYAEHGQGITPAVLPDLSTLPALEGAYEDPESASLTGRVVERWRIEERL